MVCKSIIQTVLELTDLTPWQLPWGACFSDPRRSQWRTFSLHPVWTFPWSPSLVTTKRRSAPPPPLRLLRKLYIAMCCILQLLRLLFSKLNKWS